MEKVALRLAFCFQARVGKDTACDYFVKTAGAVKLSFAQPIYDIMHFAQDTCGFTREKDRPFLQYIGSEWGRAKNENVWVAVMENKIKSLPLSTPIVVSDCRFPNEVAALRKLGFKIIKIERPEANALLNKEISIANHASETSLLDYKDWDCIIDNNSTLDDFYSKLHLVYLFNKSTMIMLDNKIPRI